jgi:hypothetical protein
MLDIVSPKPALWPFRRQPALGCYIVASNMMLLEFAPIMKMDISVSRCNIYLACNHTPKFWCFESFENNHVCMYIAGMTDVRRERT